MLLLVRHAVSRVTSFHLLLGKAHHLEGGFSYVGEEGLLRENALGGLLFVSLLDRSAGDHHLREWWRGIVLYLRSTDEDGTDLV